jgi:hypothetical protein
VTARAPASQASIRRAIQAARREGLHAVAIRADGTVILAPNPIPIDEVLPAAPLTEEEVERRRWVDQVKT